MERSVLKVSLNLEEQLELKDSMCFFGFTAATGGLFENHDILSLQIDYFE